MKEFYFSAVCFLLFFSTVRFIYGIEPLQASEVIQLIRSLPDDLEVEAKMLFQEFVTAQLELLELRDEVSQLLTSMQYDSLGDVGIALLTVLWAILKSLFLLLKCLFFVIKSAGSIIWIVTEFCNDLFFMLFGSFLDEPHIGGGGGGAR